MKSLQPMLQAVQSFLDPSDRQKADLIEHYSERATYLRRAIHGLELLEGQVPRGGPTLDDPDIRLALSKMAERRYGTLDDARYIVFNDISTSFDDGNRQFYVPNLYLKYGTDYQPIVPDEFARAYLLLEDQSQPYVYTVEPKEYAQNISDVAAAEQLRNFVLAIDATLPQAAGAKVGAYLDSVYRSQELLQGILRKPLVVGFLNQNCAATCEFGWVLGPRFEIVQKGWFGDKHPEAGYCQGVVQHSVQATVAVPGWAQCLHLRVDRGWMRGNRQPEWEPRVFPVHCPSDDCLVVRLPGDMPALTQALLTLNSAWRRDPVILPRWAEPSAPQEALAAGQPGKILVRGSNLWRNPEVYIGSQKADKVSVLPDMQGLLAEFNTVQGGSGTSSRTTHVDLSVVTSQGIASLPKVIDILPPSGATPALEGAVTVLTPTVRTGEKIVLLADAGLIARHPADVALQYTPASGVAWRALATQPSISTDEHGTSLSWKVDKDLLDDSGELLLDLQVQNLPHDDYRSIPSFAAVKGPIVFLKDADLVLDRKQSDPFRLVKCENPGGEMISLQEDIVLKVPEARLLLTAYPKAETGLQNAAVLVLTPAEGTKGSTIRLPLAGCLAFDSKGGVITIRGAGLLSQGKEKRNAELDLLYNQIGEGSPAKYNMSLEFGDGEALAMRGIIQFSAGRPVIAKGGPG